MEDSQIIALYYDRDQQAIAETDVKYGSYCRSIAWNILNRWEDAEECLNDTWLAAWNTMPPELPRCLRVFLGRITRNLSIDRWRAGRAQKRCGLEILLSELEDCIPASMTVEQQVDSRQLGDLLSRWLDGLEREDRKLFVRRYWYGLSVRELAEERNCAPNRISQRLLRLRGKLKTALEQEGVSL